MSNELQELQSLIDEHKEDISNGLYLELSNKFQALYRLSAEPNYVFFNLTLGIPAFNKASNGKVKVSVSRFDMTLRISTDEDYEDELKESRDFISRNYNCITISALHCVHPNLFHLMMSQIEIFDMNICIGNELSISISDAFIINFTELN